MRAGELRRRITLEQETRTSDGGGGSAQTWAPFATVYAKVAPLTGTEAGVASQVGSAVTHRVEIRYRAGVTSKMRINYGGRILNVRAVLNIEERNRELHLMCEELKPVG